MSADLAEWLTQIWDAREWWANSPTAACDYDLASEKRHELARIAADREILAACRNYCWGDVAPAPCGRCDRIGCRTLRLLAQPYADRPGFRDEWKP